MIAADVVRRYEAAYTRLRVSAGNRVSHLWATLGGVTDAHAERFVPAAAAASGAAEIAAARLVAAYMTVALRGAGERRPNVPVDARETTGKALRGVDPDVVWFRPVIAARSGLANGKRYVEAFEAARQRAQLLAETNVLLAQRAATVAAASGDNPITGYRRVLAGTCDLCADAVDDLYGVEEFMPVHPSCQCSVAPVIGRVDPAVALNAVAVRTAEEPTTTEVHEHGELGPVLTDADHEFADEDE